MSEMERRAMSIEEAELRAAGDAPRLEGYAAMFGKRTSIGDYFTEEIQAGAFADVLDNDVRALFNHSPDHVLGRTKSGTLRLTEDKRGLKYEVDLNPDDPDAMKLHSRIKRGDISGSSFSFSVSEDAWDHKKNPPHRTIVKVGTLFDVAAVTFPAYEQAKVSARAQEQAEAVAEAEREDAEAQQRQVDEDALARERERLRLAETEA